MRDRHSALETAVFGLAGLLALILAYYAYARWSSSRPAPRPEAPPADAPSAQAPASSGDDDDSAGFRGGGAVPTVRFSQPKRTGKK